MVRFNQLHFSVELVKNKYLSGQGFVDSDFNKPAEVRLLFTSLGGPAPGWEAFSVIGPAFLRMTYNSQAKAFSLLLESTLSTENETLQNIMEEKVK